MNHHFDSDWAIVSEKYGIPQQEAEILLERHDGSLAGALKELEQKETLKKADMRQGNDLLSILACLYSFRIGIRKGETPVINISLFFSLLVLILKPSVLIIGALLSLLLGYRFDFGRQDREFDPKTLRPVKQRITKMTVKAADAVNRFVKNANERK